MKKILLLIIVSVAGTGIFANPHRIPDSSVNIKKIFHQDFPEVTHFNISTLNNEYVVYYNDQASHNSGRVYYDTDGNILQTYKYYTGEQLPPFIRAKIKEKYDGKTISNVTEVTNADQHYYSIILSDSEQMFIVNSDEKGNLQLMKKYKKAWYPGPVTKTKLIRCKFGFCFALFWN